MSIFKIALILYNFFNWVGDGARTRNLRLHRPPLLPIELRPPLLPAGLEPATLGLRGPCSTD